MTVEEGAAANVFTGNANAIPGNQQRSIGQILGHAPVDRQLALAHGGAVLDDLLDAECKEKPSGMVVKRWDRRFSSLSGTVVSQVSMYCLVRNGVQSMVFGCL
jgi:hypothetical protein